LIDTALSYNNNGNGAIGGAKFHNPADSLTPQQGRALAKES
jgi:hypothetical protein